MSVTGSDVRHTCKPSCHNPCLLDDDRAPAMAATVARSWAHSIGASKAAQIAHGYLTIAHPRKADGEKRTAEDWIYAVLYRLHADEQRALLNDNWHDTIVAKLSWAVVYIAFYGVECIAPPLTRAERRRIARADHVNALAAKNWHRLRPLRLVVKRKPRGQWAGTRNAIRQYDEILECGHTYIGQMYWPDQTLAKRRRCKYCGAKNALKELECAAS